jgi:branched-chain amino acid transport system substrate-binding protein
MEKLKLFLLLIGLIFIFACEADTGPINKNTSGEVKIGVILSVSGDLAPVGDMIRKGIELAVDEINLVGGVDDSKIILVFADDASVPSEASKAAEEFVKDDSIKAIIGGVSDESTIAIASLTSKVRMPLISPAASGVGITGVGPYIFRNGLTDYAQAKTIAEYAFMAKNLRTFAVIYPNTRQGVSFNRIFTQRIQEIGGKILANEMYSTGTMNDFSGILRKLKVLEPQVVYFPGQSDDIVIVTRQAEEVGLSTVFLGTNDWSQDQVVRLGGEYMDGDAYTAAFYKDSPDGVVANFVSRFRLKFQKDPDGWAAQGYDAARLIAQAMFAGGKDRQGIKDGLLTIKNFPGVTGQTSFRPDGETDKEIVILGVSGKKVVRVQ